MKPQRFFLALSTAILLVGCASTPNISLDKATVGPINTAALLRVTESQSVMVRNLSGLPGLGGIVGGAIAGEGEAKHTAAFVEAYNAGSTRLSASLVADLQQNISAEGMSVTYLANEFAQLKNGGDDYSHIQTDKNALLSVWFGSVGYIADGVIDAPYEPWVVVNVRLLQGQTKQILSQKTYTAGYKAKTEGAVFVPCAADYRFATFNKLMTDFGRATEALVECEKAIARQAAQDLR